MTEYVGFPELKKHFKIGYVYFAVNTTYHGSGAINGDITKEMVNYANAKICVFDRTNRALIWEFSPNSDGRYSVRNINPAREYFLIAFDNAREYNAVIEDMVKPYDILQ